MLFSKNKNSNSDFDDYDDEPYSMGLPWNTAKGNVELEAYTNEVDTSSAPEQNTFVLTEEIPAKLVQIEKVVAPDLETTHHEEPVFKFQEEAIIPQAKPEVESPEKEIPAKVVNTPAIKITADLSLPASEDIIRRFGTNIRSAIGVGTVIEGSFCFDAPVCIDGVLNGEIESSSVLFVGAQAEVNAKIKVGGLIVLGKVQGEIQAEELVEIREGGEIEANVETKRIIIQDGGLFKGQCRQNK